MSFTGKAEAKGVTVKAGALRGRRHDGLAQESGKGERETSENDGKMERH